MLIYIIILHYYLIITVYSRVLTDNMRPLTSFVMSFFSWKHPFMIIRTEMGLRRTYSQLFNNKWPWQLSFFTSKTHPSLDNWVIPKIQMLSFSMIFFSNRWKFVVIFFSHFLLLFFRKFELLNFQHPQMVYFLIILNMSIFAIFLKNVDSTICSYFAVLYG